MPPLTSHSLQALRRLAAYHPPTLASGTTTTWTRLPLSRRAAVLVLLFKGRHGELRVCVTMRGRGMRAYAGQAACPGGHADSLSETPITVARREAWEEIGLPLPRSTRPPPPTQTNPSTPIAGSEHTSASHDPDDCCADETPNLPKPFTITHLCEMPTYLAKTCLGVKPCVAYLGTAADAALIKRAGFLRPSPDPSVSSGDSNAAETSSSKLPIPTDESDPDPDPETLLTPRIQASEVSAVFSAPLEGFLHSSWPLPPPPPPSPSPSSSHPRSPPSTQRSQPPKAKKWYTAHPLSWRTSSRPLMHAFAIPTAGQTVHLSPSTSSPSDSSSASGATKSPEKPPSHFPVTGLTALFLIDVARIAYGRAPEFEYTSEIGEEAVIGELLAGRMGAERVRGEEFGKDEWGTVGSWLEEIARDWDGGKKEMKGML